MTFGERLKELREAAGLSQDALARAAGVSTSTVAKMEQRAIDPAWSTVRALARGLGVSCQVFEVEDKPAEPPAKKRGKKK